MTDQNLPAPIAERGITKPQWMALSKSLYPGAKPDSILMVVDYCKVRGLDPMKKPCHIVPMKVKDAKTNNYEWRDVVLPGIYELRTTAQRTGEYLGHSKPEYGEDIECGGVTAPAWCEMTLYRWNPKASMKAEFTVRVFFTEAVGLKDGRANQRWAKAPIQMLTKCTEAAGLREAFPDELGGEMSAEEMDGQHPHPIDVTPGRENGTRDLNAELGLEPEAEDAEIIEGESEHQEWLGQYEANG